MKTTKLSLLVAAFAALVAPLAHADSYPASVVGNWSVTGNLSVGTLSITSQGAPTTGKCPAIAGTIYGATLQGFYCPGSGRIHFVRKLANNATIQAWTGQLSDSGPVLRMGGVFSSVDVFHGGNLGEYNFQAQK
jgi:predicted secreted Zn-dependent protease